MTASNCSASLGTSAKGFLHSVQVSLLKRMAVGTGERGRLCCPLAALGPQCFFIF